MVVPYQPPPKDEPPRVDWDEVIIPFKFFDLSRIEQLDPLDSEGHLMHIATGEFPPRERRPEEPFTAWVTMAHLGLIEEGGPLLKAELTREQRLEAAREVLTEDELVMVETNCRTQALPLDSSAGVGRDDPYRARLHRPDVGGLLADSGRLDGKR